MNELPRDKANMSEGGRGISFFIRFLRDDSGQDLLEYAILSAMVGVGSALLFPAIATLMNTAYAGPTGWIYATQAIWEPCAPGLGACP